MVLERQSTLAHEREAGLHQLQRHTDSQQALEQRLHDQELQLQAKDQQLDALAMLLK